MKNFIKKNWALIGFILAFILDANYGVLERFIKDPFSLNIAKGAGSLLLAYFTSKSARIIPPKEATDNKQKKIIPPKEATDN